ncbi:MAG: sigma-70 family RNA polymerase sigma factor [Bacteroidetes bacterium]|nr:sigma-70 family RNA polymerase sigma factor [Bacteroidota bacterium]
MQDKIAYERELLYRVAEGDQHAFELLFRAYRKGIYTAALRMTQSVAVSEEIVQDVFLKIWMKREGLREVEQFSAWSFTIAQNAIYSAMRKRYKEEAREREMRAAAPSDLGGVENPEYQTLLEEAVEHLPSKQKDTYILIKQEGLKRQQAASILKVSAETVKSNLEHAIRNIKAYCIAKKEAT